MKVLLANSETSLRGGEFQTFLLGRGLERAGCEVMIATRVGSALEEKVSGSLPCTTFRFERVPLATPVALSRFIARWRPDIIHAQTSDAHTHVWLARRLLRKAPPLVVSRRVAFQVAKDLFSLFKYRTGVAHYIPISAAAAASLGGVGVPPADMTIIPSGVDVKAFQGAKGSPGSLEKWGAAKQEVLIGTVAAFEAEKGHLVLVRAAARVVQIHPRTRFIFIGEGRLRNKIEAEISRSGLSGTVVLAALEAPLEEVLSHFDIFVLPSLQEGLSTALIAALAAGVPAVASLTGGIPDVLTPECGILVPPGDAGALAGAIVKLEHDVELRKKMGIAGRKRALDFDISLVVRRTLEVYGHVLRGKISR